MRRIAATKRKRLSFYRLLIVVFRISYVALKSESIKKETFHRWNSTKSRLDLKLNSAVFQFIADADFVEEPSIAKLYRQFVLDAVVQIIAQHYKRRESIFRFCKRAPFGEKSAFITLSLLQTYIDETAHLAKGVSRLRRKYKIDTKQVPNIVDLAIGFPTHSFSTSAIPSDRADSKVPVSSFGEFLSSYYSKTPHETALVSIDEYCRPSKKEEEGINTVEGSIYISEYPRIRISAATALSTFCFTLPEVFLHSLKSISKVISSRSSVLLEIIFLRKWTRSYAYKQLIASLQADKKIIRTVYVLPFNDVGLLRYEELSSTIRTYNYSHNIFIPPSRMQHAYESVWEMPLDAILSDVPISAFCLSGLAIGFTDVFTQLNDVKNILNARVGCKLPIEGTTQPPQRPVLLGYEVPHKKSDNGSSKCVAVFDVPPETKEIQLSRSLIGDRTCDNDVIAEFLLESLETCISEGLRVILKPKYSLSNYDMEYQTLLEGFFRRFGDSLTVANPYSRMVPLLVSVDACISAPYTSTKLVAEALGKPSIYFMPEIYRRSFRDASSTRVVFGRSELSSFLRQINSSERIYGSVLGGY